MFTPTSLDLGHWLKVQEIWALLYAIKNKRRWEKVRIIHKVTILNNTLNHIPHTLLWLQSVRGHLNTLLMQMLVYNAKITHYNVYANLNFKLQISLLNYRHFIVVISGATFFTE